MSLRAWLILVATVAALSSCAGDQGPTEWEQFQDDYEEFTCAHVEACGLECTIVWDFQATIGSCDETDFLPDKVDECFEFLELVVEQLECTDADDFLIAPPCDGILFTPGCGLET